MPFTLAHPAAVVPLLPWTRARLRPAALVFGSMTPDFEYFLHMRADGRFGHNLLGLPLFCLPAGWIALWLFDRYGRAGLSRLLPDGWVVPAGPRSMPIAATSLAILLGAATHLVWDGLTHAGGWCVAAAPALANVVDLGPVSVPWFKVMQHGSTLLGLVVLTAWVRRWIAGKPRVALTEVARRSLPFAAILGGFGVLNGLRFLDAGARAFVVSGGVAVTFGLGFGLVILGLGRRREPA